MANITPDHLFLPQDFTGTTLILLSNSNDIQEATLHR